MRRIITTLLLTAALVSALPLTGAHATNHRPPDARLIIGERVQTRAPYTFCWTFQGGGICADGFPSYRGAISGRPGQEAKIRLQHPARIERVDLDGYSRLRTTGYSEQPYGDHRDFPLRLRANRANGKINGWTILFRLPRREGHLYLDLSVDWRRGGDAFYALHAFLRK